jgi:hypothetical protein
MLPNFLVIGAPRSGTTWIHENLLRHPQVYVPHVKEVHFFDQKYDRGIEYYESYFSGRKDELAIGETTPAYLHHDFSTGKVAKLIHSHLPNVKLIASLRNPIDRVYSRYWNSKAKYAKNLSLSFEDKLEDRPHFIYEGFYAEQLTRYYQYFSKDQILVLLHDDLVANAAEFMSKIYKFIGVDPDFDAGLGSSQVNAATGKKRLAKSRLAWILSRSLQYVGLIPLSELVRKKNSVEIPAMNPETRKRLLDIYRSENEKLGILIGRDVSIWNS